jgi:hypothetical protein
MSLRPGCRKLTSLRLALTVLAPLCFILLLLASCSSSSNTSASNSTPTAGASSGGSPTPAGASQAKMQRMSSSESVGAGVTGTVSVTAFCPLGTTMLSGGYGLGGGDNAASTQILADRPDTPASWTVVAENAAIGGPYTLTAYANCLKSKVLPTISIVKAATFSAPADGNFHEASAACPSGSVVSGGGFTSEIGANASLPINGVGTAPDANIWDTQIGMTQDQPETPVVYAVCATSPSFLDGSIPTTVQPITTTSGDLSLQCPAGQLLVGGGFALDHVGANVYGSTLSEDGSQWTVSANFFPFAGTPPAVNETVYAVCVRLSPSAA